MDKLELRALLAKAVRDGDLEVRMVRTNRGNVKCWSFANTEVST